MLTSVFLIALGCRERSDRINSTLPEKGIVSFTTIKPITVLPTVAQFGRAFED